MEFYFGTGNEFWAGDNGRPVNGWLDAVGARTWKLIEDHGALGAVHAALHSEYDVPPSVLERDLLELVDQLCAKGLTRVAANSK